MADGSATSPRPKAAPEGGTARHPGDQRVAGLFTSEAHVVPVGHHRTWKERSLGAIETQLRCRTAPVATASGTAASQHQSLDRIAAELRKSVAPNACAPASLVKEPLRNAPATGGDHPPLCLCHKPSVERVTRKAGPNQGREFLVCSAPREVQCSFFLWKTPHVKSERSQVAVSESVLPGERQQTLVDESAVVISLATLHHLRVGLPFHLNGAQELSAHMMSLPGAQSTGPHTLQLPVTSHDGIVTLAAKLGMGVQSDINKELLKMLKANSRRPVPIEASWDIKDHLPEAIHSKLMPFQRQGVEFVVRNGGVGLIGDEMGLGKTAQAIAIARVFRKEWPVLVICPSSLRFNWKDEMCAWLGPEIEEASINVVMKGTDGNNPVKLINIVSYDLIGKVSPSMQQCKVVIVDESHYCKNMATKRTRTVIPIVQQAIRKLLLSGTSMVARPAEIYPQLNALIPSVFNDWKHFASRYCDAKPGPFGLDVRGAKNLTELNMLMTGTVFLRRLKDGVLQDLPAKMRTITSMELTGSSAKDVRREMAALEALEAQASTAKSEIDAAKIMHKVRGQMSKAFAATGLAKVDFAINRLEDLLASGVKVIVFAHHQEVMDIIDNFLKTKAKVGFIRIDGGTQQNRRQDLCHEFQKDASCRVALLGITAAGVGLTLTAASKVLFAELNWTPGNLVQCEDRAHRIGQRDCVAVEYLIAKKSLDARVWKSVCKKLDVVGESLDRGQGDSFRPGRRSSISFDDECGSPHAKRSRTMATTQQPSSSTAAASPPETLVQQTLASFIEGSEGGRECSGTKSAN